MHLPDGDSGYPLPQGDSGHPLPRHPSFSALGAAGPPTITCMFSPCEAWEPRARGPARLGIGWAQEDLGRLRPASPVPHRSQDTPGRPAETTTLFFPCGSGGPGGSRFQAVFPILGDRSRCPRP